VTKTIDLAAGQVEIRCSTLSEGDFHIDVPAASLERCRQAFTPGIWTQLDEVHGTDVRVVAHPGEHDRAVGDAMVTHLAEVVLAVWVGDCAPVALVGTDGALGAVHAGWKGALDGVLSNTVTAMGCQPGAVTGYLGPCIRPCCYEFGADQLASFRRRFGDRVATNTAWGAPALDLPQVVTTALGEVGVPVVDIGGCTGCRDDLWFSHRRRRQPQRQVMTVCRRAAR